MLLQTRFPEKAGRPSLRRYAWFGVGLLAAAGDHLVRADVAADVLER